MKNEVSLKKFGEGLAGMKNCSTFAAPFEGFVEKTSVL